MRSSARMVTRRAPPRSSGFTRFQLYTRLKRYQIEVSPE